MLMKNQTITTILDRAPSLNMPDWYLAAGCIAQTAWNVMHGFPATAHIKDYDLVYFDPDLSYDAENSYIEEGKKLFKDVDSRIEIKNEARVHLWYQDHFGYPITPYQSIEHAIDSWPTTATAIGVRRRADGRLQVYAPFGLDDLLSMTVRPNTKQINKEIYMDKTEKWSRLWPKLKIIPWKATLP
ncbi:MAG: nucleotidyltransferase family protein [Nitrososphaerota archaeon]|nr:nucleotidyltransferase family protein [Nitrososphaerota archaeon]